MGNDYVVVGWGYSKKDGNPYSRCAKLVVDEKEGKYSFIDMNNVIFLDHHEEIGKVITAKIEIC